jgi:CheY-like chemotaxis protein
MGKTILLVDDEAAFVELLTLRLEANHYRVITARSGAEALAKAKAEAPDLILLDVMMPGMDGGEVAQAIRQRRNLAAIPIIFLTAAVSDKEAKAWGGKVGGEVFVSKTSDASVLLDAIKSRL